MAVRSLRNPRVGGGDGKAEKPLAAQISVFLTSAVRPRSVKIRRHDADDMVRVVVEPQSSAENMRIRAKEAFPESVADNHFEVKARRWIVRVEHAA
jgi:hypothetical protein